MRTTIFFGVSKSFPVNPVPAQTGLKKNDWSTQKVRGKDNRMHCQVWWILVQYPLANSLFKYTQGHRKHQIQLQSKTFEEDLAVCKSCCFLAREAGQQAGRGLMMVIKPLILIRAPIWEWIEDFVVKVMIFGEQTGWSGVENDYQAFNTNQGKNLGWWVED